MVSLSDIIRLENLVGMLLLSMVLSGFLCIIGKGAFRGKHPANVVLTWLCLAIIITALAALIWVGVHLVVM